MKRIRSLLRGNIRQYAMVIALIVVVVIFEFLTKGVLLKPLNISNLIQQNAYVLILAIGMLLCILTIGNIDLSVGSVVGLVGALSAIFILKMNMPIWIAIILSLMAGFVIGAWQGLWIAYIGVPAFIVTLGGQLIFRGLTMVALQGTSLAPLLRNPSAPRSRSSTQPATGAASAAADPSNPSGTTDTNIRSMSPACTASPSGPNPALSASKSSSTIASVGVPSA